MPPIDWSQLFTFTVSPIELVVRGTLTYFFLFCLFRFVVHRDVGGLGISDLLVLVIIADASQNAMAGEYKSIVDGFVLIVNDARSGLTTCIQHRPVLFRGRIRARIRLLNRENATGRELANSFVDRVRDRHVAVPQI